jgi:hypothetical protein
MAAIKPLESMSTMQGTGATTYFLREEIRPGDAYIRPGEGIWLVIHVERPGNMSMWTSMMEITYLTSAKDPRSIVKTMGYSNEKHSIDYWIIVR